MNEEQEALSAFLTEALMEYREMNPEVSAEHAVGALFAVLTHTCNMLGVKQISSVGPYQLLPTSLEELPEPNAPTSEMIQ